jgi:hypothetical protein
LLISTGDIANWRDLQDKVAMLSPILDSALFAAVQGKLAAQAVARRCRLRGPSALLTGRIFDAYGNRKSKAVSRPWVRPRLRSTR